MNVTFTLTSGSSATAAGPFNISGTTNTNVVSLLATGITKNQLLTGHTINSVNDAITGGTIASTGTCTTTTPWSVTPPEPPIESNCWCVTYETVPGDLYVRYRDTAGNVQTTLINSLETMDNGNGTYTGCICVYPTGAYSTPVCVQGGIEVTCPDSFVQGGTCTTAGVCFLN